MPNSEMSVDAQAIVAALDRLTVAVGETNNRLDAVASALIMIGSNHASSLDSELDLFYKPQDFEHEWIHGYPRETGPSPVMEADHAPLP